MTSSKGQTQSKLLGRLKALAAPEKNGVKKLVRVEDVLEAAFEDGVKKHTFTEEEHQEFALLITKTIDIINRAVLEIGLKFDSDRGLYNLMLRSGLQFIVDKFGSNPDKEQQAWEKKLKCSIKTVDEGIQNWRDCDYFTEDNVAHSYEDLCRPPDVPESHTWWLA